jgi:hypothetical protein
MCEGCIAACKINGEIFFVNPYFEIRTKTIKHAKRD